MPPAPDRSLAWSFASDNTAPACPEAMEALLWANDLGCLPSYGDDDEVTGTATRTLQAAFETSAPVHFVFNGTAANALSVASACDSFESVFCHEEAHLEKDEASAPEFFRQGLKLHLLPGAGGRVDLAGAGSVLAASRGVHSPQPRLLSLTQATELGTVYSLQELRDHAGWAHARGLLVHVDGARFANAVASLGVSPADLSWRAGVDILSLGGTKAGIGLSEAVIPFHPDLARRFAHRRKQAGQLASRMRFLAAPWIGALRDGAWIRHAASANASAESLARGLVGLGLRLAAPRQANGVFVHLPAPVADSLHAAGWHFYRFLDPDVFRFMCSWRTSPAEVAALLDAVQAALAAPGSGRPG